MKFNKVSKKIFSALATKLTGLKEKLPKDERERVKYLSKRCKDFGSDSEMDMETYIKMNGIILLTIWFSNYDYDTSYDIVALENIIREYEKDSSIEEFFPPSIDYESSYQMLIRNYVERYDYPVTLIDGMFENFKNVLGPGEDVAYEDEYLSYEFSKWDFSNLKERTDIILDSEKGEFADCYACIINRLIRMNICNKDYIGADKLISKIFDEKLTCDKIPKRTHIQKLLVDYQLARLDGNSKSLEKNALRKLDKNESEIWEAYYLLDYCKQTKNTELAKQIISRFENIIIDCILPEKILYSQAAYEITGDDKYYNMGLDLAKKYDMRNGNNRYTKIVKP